MSKPAFEPFAAAASPAVSPSQALVSAALTGLLCAATPACVSTETDSGTRYVVGPTCCPRGGSDSGSGGASNTGGNATSGDASSTGGTATSGGASSTGGIATSGGASSTGGMATTGGASSTGGGGGAVTGTGGLSSGGSTQSAGGTQSDAAPSTGGADGGSIVPPPSDAGVDCYMDGGLPVITSSVIVTDMTLEKFTADCDARHGVIEIPPHCGGFNTCMGMSYDSGTQVLTEHTCKGMNTCNGYSCVVCPTK